MIDSSSIASNVPYGGPTGRHRSVVLGTPDDRSGRASAGAPKAAPNRTMWRGQHDKEAVTVIIKAIEPASDPALVQRLLSIQHAAYRVEAALIGDDRIPALHEGLEELRCAALRWLGAFDDDRLIGAVAWAERRDSIDIDRLVVSPEQHRRGAGRGLVREALSIAGGRLTTVTTGRDNLPALALCHQLGFDQAGDSEVEAGLWVRHLAHLP